MFEATRNLFKSYSTIRSFKNGSRLCKRMYPFWVTPEWDSMLYRYQKPKDICPRLIGMSHFDIIKSQRCDIRSLVYLFPMDSLP